MKKRREFEIKRREFEIKHTFIKYLNLLIKDFKGIEYDKVRCEKRDIELLAKDFVKDLTKFLTVLKTKVTITDILGHIEVEEFTDDMPVSIIVDTRFQKLTIPDNLIDLRKLKIDLGNNYSITAQGDRDDISIIIKNKTITAPKLKDENPGGTILFYRIDKVVDRNGDGYYRHRILIEHPIANMNFINHYMANLNFIKHYEESADDDPVETDVEVDDEDVDNNVEKDVEVEEDDFQPHDWFPSDKRKEESNRTTESIQSDNNKTLNFSLPGPNGTKMSINLNINITFE